MATEKVQCAFTGICTMPPSAACASPLSLKLRIESSISVKRLRERSSHYWRIALQAAVPSPPLEPCTLSKVSGNQQNKHTVMSTAEDGLLCCKVGTKYWIVCSREHVSHEFFVQDNG